MLIDRLRTALRPRALALAVLVLPAVALFGGAAAQHIAAAGAAPEIVAFDLFPNPKTLACLTAGGGKTPSVHAIVRRGKLNDTLALTLRNFKPGLDFDLFTVQRSNQLADGSADPAFKNFGLAWYQSDIHVPQQNERDDDGRDGATVTIRTILLDQIFGFDPDVSLAPTNTFQLGFWFNNPADAAPCGFDVTKPTPFNGEHKAGPLAFISRPNAVTGLGPLCSNPDTSKSPATCNP